jgi:RNA polymerase sigma factor (sigma-70 family)
MLQRDLPNFADEHQFKAFLSRIITNKINAKYRHLSKQVRTEGTYTTKEIEDFFVSLCDPRLDPAKQVEQNEQVRVLLGKLNPLQRQLVELRLQSFTFEEIADLMSKNAGTLRVWMQRIRDEFWPLGIDADFLREG